LDEVREYLNEKVQTRNDLKLWMNRILLLEVVDKQLLSWKIVELF